MTDFEQTLVDTIISADGDIELLRAPNMSAQIWQRHQRKKFKNIVAIAASISAVVLTVWFTNSGPNLPMSSNSIQQLQVRNAELEKQLAQMGSAQLTPEQQLIVAHWYNQVAMIDEAIELQQAANIKEQVWSKRKLLLTQIVEFYQHPSNYYEI